MVYQQSFEIERRLDRVLSLIRTGRYSTPMLADEIGVSIPTISRCVTALKTRGHNIKAKKHGESWRYVLASESNDTARGINTICELTSHAEFNPG